MAQASIQHENRGEQLKLFINNQMFADVVLLVGPSRRLFYAHRLVLAATSPYFHTMFSSGMKESRAEEIALPDVDETTFELVLEYMYTGKLEVPMEIILPLLVLADQFQCESLCTKLLRNIEGNMKEIMHTPHFLHLPHQLVATLIGSDRLQIDELELFQGLLRWGEKQVQLQSDYEAKGGENSKSHGDRGSERMEEDSEEDEIFFSREERERYKVEMEKRKNQQRPPPESLDGQRTERLREVVKSLMEYVRFPLMDGKDLTSIVERSGVVPYELLFEAYRFKTNPDLEDNHNLPHNRSMARNSVFCSFAGCRRKAIYACCNKKKDGYYETGCEYFSCELHTFHCSANCRKVGRPCEGILHHCDRNKGYCGLITEFGRDRKNSL